ncbi:cytochrome c, class I [Novosphingobium nitrogenifigens DSM 19370]|uniref:Cytochrome c, class I n=1 Tax=Novosphingobium nitrogenifigens DSM 19370 TaxID=983920 RepID=F1ZAD1_9SPHN|nr:c-type cytochrome [Novosphingobium nitrogenifigens]EGD58461.1 cytochrome c, class I [Novosphingobium nitrogenifigens DSM 19370]
MKFAAVMLAGAALAAAGIATNANAAGGDAAHGKTVFARCAACHDLNTGKTLLGPTLKGIVGRKSGSIAGFAYSPAMKAKGVVWTPGNLDQFITSPTKFVPGTRMPFAGLPDAKDRADVIAYLQQAAH